MGLKNVVYPLCPFDYSLEKAKIIKAEGVFLHDEYGNCFLDGISGLWNVPLGYDETRIINSVVAQLKKIPFINLITERHYEFEEYAHKLLKKMPLGHDKIIFTCSGTESVDVSIKIARKYQKLIGNPSKNRIASLKMSYHGTSHMAMALSEMDKSESLDYLISDLGVYHIDPPYCKCCLLEDMSKACIDKVKKSLCECLEAKKAVTAAIIIEPIIGSGGIIVLPKWYLDVIAKFCNENQVLLIFDEVATGFGRTGDFFAFETHETRPDLVCLSKGINNGYLPFGAVSISQRIVNTFINHGATIEHFSTQNGNLLACVSANTTLDILNNSGIVNQVKQKGDYLKESLIEKLSSINGVFEIRGKGLMIGIEFRNHLNEHISSDQLLIIVEKIRHKGLLVYMFFIENQISGISLFPPFTISIDMIEKIVNILNRVLLKELKYIY